MFNLQEYKQKPDRLTDVLPWAALVRSGIVLNKDGSFQQTIRFRGPDLESSTEQQLVSATARLNNALKRLGSGWALFIEARRQHALSYPLPSASYFPEGISWLVDAERRELFERKEVNYESHYYLTFQYLPPVETVSKFSNIFLRNKKENKSDDEKTLEFFASSVNRLFDILKDFMFEADFLNDEETLTYLHRCISEKNHGVKVPNVPMYLDGVLADTPLIGGLDPKLGKYYLRTISIMGFPSSSVPAILDHLNYLPLEYRWITRFLPLDKLEAEKILKNYRRQWFSKRKGVLTLLSETISKSESAMVDSGAMRKAQDADAALQELADDYVSFGYFTATITVWDEDPTVLYEKQREVERVINSLGFTTVPETVNAVEAWLSSLPGQVYANVRMPLIHSLNLAHLIPFSAIWAGPERDHHLSQSQLKFQRIAPPLFFAHTIGNTPFRYCLHIGDVGHQMIIGPTGTGKSVLLNFMALQFLRYQQAQVFVFYEVGSSKEGGLVFQPLARIDQKEERIWATDWICALLSNERVEISPEIKEMIWAALTNLAHVPMDQRTLTGLKVLVQDKKIRLALDPYVLGGPFGEILDADNEEFDLHFWQCFEMEEMMSMPKVIPPVLDYIFHVIEKRLTGRPTLLILDEAWVFLDHPIFSNKIREWLKTLRKYNVSVVFATQSVEDALRTSIAPALIESCPSRVFLPNDRALEPGIYAYYEKLGLNDKQIKILANAVPKQQYYFESPNGNCLFDLSLGELALTFCAANTPEDRKLIWQILSDLKKEDESEKFYQRYLRIKNLTWAVNAIAEYGNF